MSTKQASPVTGAIILAGFVALAVTVLFSVRAKLQSAGPHTEHHASWVTAHAAPHAPAEAVAPPRTALTAYESIPRPGAKVRTLREYYSRRAYAGAPPIIFICRTPCHDWRESLPDVLLLGSRAWGARP